MKLLPSCSQVASCTKGTFVRCTALSLEEGVVQCRSIEGALIQCRWTDSDGIDPLHVCACSLVSDTYGLDFVTPSPLQGVQPRIAAGLDGNDGDGGMVMDFAPFAVLDVLFVLDGIEDVLLTGQACLPALSG